MEKSKSTLYTIFFNFFLIINIFLTHAQKKCKYKKFQKCHTPHTLIHPIVINKPHHVPNTPTFHLNETHISALRNPPLVHPRPGYFYSQSVIQGFLICQYSLGVTPNCFLKLVEKCESVLKPVRSEISEMLYLPSLSSSAARLSLYCLKKTLGFSPVRPLIL